jgi:hypothetical protein
VALMSIPLRRTASTTASLGSITADATRPRRFRLYDVLVGSEASPADNAFLYVFQRCTAAGTTTGVTPRNLDPASATTELDAGQNATVEPTYTASTELLFIPVNQRATMRWVAAPGCELVFPATASNGVGIQTPTSSAVVITATCYVNEE